MLHIYKMKSKVLQFIITSLLLLSVLCFCRSGVYICIKISLRHQVLTWKKWQHEDFNFKYLKIPVEREGCLWTQWKLNWSDLRKAQQLYICLWVYFCFLTTQVLKRIKEEKNVTTKWDYIQGMRKISGYLSRATVQKYTSVPASSSNIL